MIDKAFRIGILMGGPSSEREISLKSGSAVYQTLLEAGYNVLAVDIISAQTARDTIRDAGINMAFIALHGRFGEDGSIQALLEDLGIPYTGSGVRASKLALSKADSKLIFKQHKIPAPNYKILHRNDSLNINDIQLPVVVKPSCEGSSIGLSIARSRAEIADAIKLAYKYDDEIILEEYIEGRELTVGILDDKPLAVIEVKPKSGLYDYTSKYTKGMTEYLVPAPISGYISKKVQELALASHKALGCKLFSRVDIIMEAATDRLFILEVNTIPGLTSMSLLPKAAAACGISFLDLCKKLIDSAR